MKAWIYDSQTDGAEPVGVKLSCMGDLLRIALDYKGIIIALYKDDIETALDADDGK